MEVYVVCIHCEHDENDEFIIRFVGTDEFEATKIALKIEFDENKNWDDEIDDKDDKDYQSFAEWIKLANYIPELKIEDLEEFLPKWDNLRDKFLGYSMPRVYRNIKKTTLGLINDSNDWIGGH
jgi:hypothetical protein